MRVPYSGSITLPHSNAADKSAVKLFLGKDFSVTYRNNINAGQAELTVHGKGRYKGKMSTAFYIAPPPS